MTDLAHARQVATLLGEDSCAAALLAEMADEIEALRVVVEAATEWRHMTYGTTGRGFLRRPDVPLLQTVDALLAAHELLAKEAVGAVIGGEVLTNG